ncbi:penicillin-binding protein activator [Shimia ponticola]|uniref:penicillin-binding protein activator n=1 Tax=Shimia ponticola TaxID=2582893 RepID=UPI0011BEFE20|nr:penicillin-binding protein activator [Shimia ponticola]
MFAVFHRLRNVVRGVVGVAGVGLLAACDPSALNLPNPGGAPSGPAVDTTEPVQVALLVPSGSGVAALDGIAVSLENAAKLAVSSLNGVEVDLRVYSTQRNTQVAVNAAAQAMNDGADIILGPLDGEAAAAVGRTVAGTGTQVLAFSNNTAIAGGNVYLLGQTFEDSARSVARFAAEQGKSKVVLIHARDVAGEAGRAAVAKAVAESGLTLSGVAGYEPSQAGVFATASSAAATARSSDADALFLTSNAAGALPIFLELLPERGLGPDAIQYLGLSRWDSDPRLFSLPGANGAWFAMPDRARDAAFKARYAATYGNQPHILASTAFDGIAAIGALWAQGGNDPLGSASLTRSAGFQGATGIFRLRTDGTNDRGLAIGTIQGGQVQTLQAAPTSFGRGFGF